MRSQLLKTLFIATLAAVAIGVACGDDDNDDVPDNAAAGGGITMPVTAALLDSVPDYGGATLVREWLADEGRVQVREYAVSQAPEQAADAVTRHFRDALVAEGWHESEARSAVLSFSKAERQIVIRRAGPQLQEPASGATLLNQADPPSGSRFFFTLEAQE